MSASFRVGDLFLHRLDVGAQRPVDPVAFFGGCPAGIVLEALPRHQRREAGAMIFIGCSCTLVEAADHTILIDPAGAGEAPAGSLHDALARIGRSAQDVDIVVCTHVHEDRVAALAGIEAGESVPVFPRARHVIHSTELAFVRDAWLSSPNERYGRIYEKSIRPVARAGVLETVTGGDVLAAKGGLSIALEDAPGHTPGHVVVRMTSAGKSVLYASDVFHHPLQILDPRICTLGDADADMALATRRAAVSTCRDEQTIIIGCHFPDAGAGRIVGSSASVAFEPISTAD